MVGTNSNGGGQTSVGGSIRSTESLSPWEITEALQKTYPHPWTLRLIRVAARSKVPIETGWVELADERQRAGLVDEHLGALAAHLHAGGNLGLALPLGSICLDADDEASARALRFFSPVWKATPSGGLHSFYSTDTDFTNTCKVKLRGDLVVDLRGHGSQVLVAPSIHPNGGSYESMHWPQSLPALPSAFAAAIRKAQEPKLSSRGKRPPAGELNLSGPTLPEGSRNDELFRIACAMRGRHALGDAELAHAVHHINATRCTPPLPEREVEALVTHVCHQYAPGGE